MGTAADTVQALLLAREFYLRWAQQRDACLRTVEQLPRSRLRTAITRLLSTQTLSQARVQADGAACCLADLHGDSVFASAGFRAPTDVFFGPSLRMRDGSAAPTVRGLGSDLGLVLMLVDLQGAAQSFLESVRTLPCLPNARKVSACARRFQADDDRAISCLKGQRLSGEATHACAVFFRENLPHEVGSRVMEMAY